MAIANIAETISLDYFMTNPPEGKEWVNGRLVEKTGTTIKHSRIQSRLDRPWRNYAATTGFGGETHVELPCRTKRQGRRSDVSYLSAELLAEFGDAAVLPQSPSLVGEIASPEDSAEGLFAKAEEYLESGCQEVWLVFPEGRRVLIARAASMLAFNPGDVVGAQVVLPGFSVAVDDLLD